MLLQHMKKTAQKRNCSPIYTKIDVPRFMNMTNILENLCKIKFTSQIFTNTRQNIWIFQFRANQSFVIKFSFHDSSSTTYSHITIQEFSIPYPYRIKNLHVEIFDRLLKMMEKLDFDFLLFHIQQPYHERICAHYGFKSLEADQMILSLKSRFFHRSTTIS